MEPKPFSWKPFVLPIASALVTGILMLSLEAAEIARVLCDAVPDAPPVSVPVSDAGLAE